MHIPAALAEVKVYFISKCDFVISGSNAQAVGIGFVAVTDV
jgi:hypothetical protein